ncbi:hypothetical protein OB905_12055 [Halobacteria archaeon AArc-dxtr1]|nr:hypothetical protein [Halobacteria archaeon AArc-dxtr1]
MNENPVIFRLNLIIGLLIANLVLLLLLFLPLEVLFLGGVVPAILLPVSALVILILLLR